MKEVLNAYDIQQSINIIMNNFELFRKCNMEKAAYSELIKLHKQAIYILEHISEYTE